MKLLKGSAVTLGDALVMFAVVVCVVVCAQVVLS